MKRVLLGMSGGVDSSVAAILLLEQGYEVCGCSLKLYGNDTVGDAESSCCSLSDISDAASVCRRLGIDHIVLNFSDVFDKYVISPFVQSYLSGSTPNPCIECNRYMKFDLMLERALLLGFDYIATGHYADVGLNSATGRYELRRSADPSKDQTYVLYCLTQHQLAHTLFPLASSNKPQIRRIAEEHGLVNSSKPDSQDICFVPDRDYASFIRRYSGTEEKPGVFTDTDGNVLAAHDGVSHFTVGQRRGLGIALGKPAFVISKDSSTGTVVLGDEQDLYKSEIDLISYNKVSIGEDGEYRLTAKVRYSNGEAPCTAVISGDTAHIIFDPPVKAAAPGQACVLYDGDRVAGGGVIV